jgi:hypothetical protein
LLVNLCLFVGLAVDRLPQMIRASFGVPKAAKVLRTVLAALALIAVGDAIGLGQEIVAQRFNGPPETRVSRSTRFQYGGAGLTPDFIDQPRQNQAWFGCRHYTWAFGADAPVWGGDVPQARAVGPGVVVEVANRTHNTFTVDVDVTSPARIVLNSAWDRGWTSDVGTVVENGDKLIAIDLPPGRYQVHARYWPRYLTLGIWMTGLGILGVMAFFLRHGLVARWRARVAR